MNVVLVGYRGTGKSAVAQRLADELRLRLVCLDDEIERRAGKSIPDVVEEIGWPGFRDLEEKVTREFASQDGQVLDCGGGVVEREANCDALRKAGTVIWLKASTDTIVRRISGDTQRPSLTGAKSFTDEVAEVLERRKPLYERLCHASVDTDLLSVADVASEVRRLIQGESIM